MVMISSEHTPYISRPPQKVH